MNPKGVPTKGMWRKVFVKALPNRITPLNSCLHSSKSHIIFKFITINLRIPFFFISFVSCSRYIFIFISVLHCY